MIEFIQNWWTMGLLIAWVIAAEVIAIRDNWWLFQMFMQDAMKDDSHKSGG
jgi:hypothetical protein